MKRGFGFLLIALFLARTAFADILFININLNFQEEEVARKAALARHENFIVFPVLTDAQKKFLAELKKMDGDRIHSDPKLRQAFPNGLPNIPAEIEKALTNMDQAHRQLTSFIITSHHVNGFYGAIGSIDDLQLYHTLASHPSAKTMHTFYGWGCYSTEPQVAIEIKRDLPQVEILAGWDGVAPNESKAADTGVLAYMLAHESNAIDAVNRHNLRGFLRNMPLVGKNLGVSNFGLEVCGDLETPHESIANITDTSKLCTHRALFGDGHGFGVMGMYYSTYQNYNSGNLPIPIDLENSDLRKFYNMAKIFSVCSDIQKLQMAHQFPTEDQIVHLIHFQNSMDNFVNFYANDLDRVSDLLLANNFRDTLFRSNLNKRSIRGYMNSLLTVAQRLTAKKSDPWNFFSQHSSDADIKLLRSTAAKINTLLLANKCVPDYWNDPPDNRQLSGPSSACLANPF